MSNEKLAPEVNVFIEKICRPQEAQLWGEKSIITPALVSPEACEDIGIFGDGLQVIYVEPIDTRPNYYVMAIDSKIDVRAEDFNFDDLLNAIANDYGDIDRYRENENGLYYNPYEPDEKPFDYTFPMLSWEGGCWGTLKNFALSPAPEKEKKDE